MIFTLDKKSLEKKLEKNIKEAYSLWENIRCYHLLKLMVKVNKDNKVLLDYIDKFDDKKLEKYYRKRAKQHDNSWCNLKKLFLSPSLYLSLILFYLSLRFK